MGERSTTVGGSWETPKPAVAPTMPSLYTGSGALKDLNSLIATTSGWTLDVAYGINDNGLIVGYGINPKGQADACLLTPAATIALAYTVNATIITGGTTATLGATVSNIASSGANSLNYTLAVTVQSGSATLGSVTPGSGSIAPGGS